MSIRMIKLNNSLLPYSVIAAASLGDPLAIQAVLRHYRSYMAKLSVCAVRDDYDNVRFVIDTDVQDYMEDALITGILNFDSVA